MKSAYVFECDTSCTLAVRADVSHLTWLCSGPTTYYPFCYYGQLLALLNLESTSTCYVVMLLVSLMLLALNTCT